MRKKTISFLFLIISDFISILLCFFLAYMARSLILPLFFDSLLQRPVFFEIYLGKYYMFSIWFVVFLYEKLYTNRQTFWEETRLLLKSTTISFALVMIAVFITQQYFQHSRLIILFAWLLSLVFLPIFRFLTKSLLISLNLWKKQVIILGPADRSSSLIDAIRKNKTLGYEIIGCLGDDPAKIGKTIFGVKVLGHIDEIEKWKEKIGFDDIIVNLPNLPSDQLIPLLKRWEQVSETIRYIPRTGDLITTGVEIENIGKNLSLTVRRNLAKPWNILFKSIFEFFLALSLMILFLPLFLVISVAIKLDSRGQVFFIQERFGKRGKRIKLIKFRSMYEDADKRLDAYLEENPEAKDEWLNFKKIKTFDPRITRVGKFIRKYSLDELPQLINVLKGEMRLVGPRPYIMEELKEVESIKSILLQVKPGITGLWQISGRSHLPFRERLNLDEYYLRNWSIWLDIVILIKTLKVSSKGEGAF